MPRQDSIKFTVMAHGVVVEIGQARGYSSRANG